MPIDIPSIPDQPKVIIPTRNPVEMAKRILDYDDTKYKGTYNNIDDSYTIEITQKQPIKDEIARRIRGLGFSNTGKRLFFYKRYSSMIINTQSERIRRF